MVDFPDDDFTARARDLCVALQAKIVVPLDEHLRVDGAVRVVAGRAAFTHGVVFVDVRFRLLAMTRGARLVQTRHRQAGG